eukprot:scaffold223222_cov21-Tisochrysis_lutea.AAC.1
MQAQATQHKHGFVCARAQATHHEHGCACARAQATHHKHGCLCKHRPLTTNMDVPATAVSRPGATILTPMAAVTSLWSMSSPFTRISFITCEWRAQTFALLADAHVINKSSLYTLHDPPAGPSWASITTSTPCTLQPWSTWLSFSVLGTATVCCPRSSLPCATPCLLVQAIQAHATQYYAEG